MSSIKFLQWITLAAAITFSACDEKADGDDEDDAPAADFRVIKISDFEDGTLDYEYEVIYDGENVVQFIEKSASDTSAAVASYKVEVTYDGSNPTATYYYKEGMDWMIGGKSEYTLQGGNIVEEIYYDYDGSDFSLDWKWTYTYNGTDLTAWASYEDDGSGTLIQDGRGEYTYEGGKLTQILSYWKYEGEYKLDDKEVFQYDGDQLTGWMDYDIDWDTNEEELSYKCDYTYSGDQLTTADYADWDAETESWSTENTWQRSYAYNADGNFIEVTYTDSDYTGSESYQYEEGKGNAKLFWYYPEETVYGEPTFKSASKIGRLRPYSEQFQIRFKN